MEIIIKLLSFIPVLKGWTIRRLSKIEITPINDSGNNIFSRYPENEKTFFVKVLFYLKSYTEIDILDIRLTYQKGFLRFKKSVEFNNLDFEVDGNLKIINRKRINPGEIYKVFISESYRSKWVEEDSYGIVKIEFEISVPALPGVSVKSLAFKLKEGGYLSPDGTQKVRIF